MRLRKPYLKKLDQIAHFEVWLVDGKYIREHVDEEFTNFGQHFRFRFIPRREFWIDHTCTVREINFFIHHLLIENRLMAAGVSYDKALERADESEKRERRKVDFIKKNPRLTHREEKIKRAHLRILKSYSKYIKVWIVDGRIVRDLFFVDFTEGGHDKVYKFIPAEELWIDNDVRRTERRYVLVHELHERYLMKHRKSYTAAHRSASRLEYECRRHPRILSIKLKEAIEQNKE